MGDDGCLLSKPSASSATAQTLPLRALLAHLAPKAPPPRWPSSLHPAAPATLAHDPWRSWSRPLPRNDTVTGCKAWQKSSNENLEKNVKKQTELATSTPEPTTSVTWPSGSRSSLVKSSAMSTERTEEMNPAAVGPNYRRSGSTFFKPHATKGLVITMMLLSGSSLQSVCQQMCSRLRSMCHTSQIFWAVCSPWASTPPLFLQSKPRIVRSCVSLQTEKRSSVFVILGGWGGKWDNNNQARLHT